MQQHGTVIVKAGLIKKIRATKLFGRQNKSLNEDYPLTHNQINTAPIAAAGQYDIDSSPRNDDHDQSEDYESSATYTLSTSTIVFDFGDLPDIYKTRSDSGGPSHRRDTVTFLGTSVDGEANGQPSPTAVGDGADEDGIRFLTPLLANTSASIAVTASTVGFLNAWIDFDANGTLGDLTITSVDGLSPISASDLALAAGAHTLTVAVPSTATGLMAARFRYSSDAVRSLRSAEGYG